MFSSQPIQGSSLPEKTLCLTFDDGPGDTKGNHPGPNTLLLAEYLKQLDIPATFFVVGEFVAQHPQIVSKVADLGHLIGNHTFSHPDMLQIFKDGKDLVSEIIKTDALISDYIPNNKVYFRAPYGSWSPDISHALNTHIQNEYQHIGPFHWDIDGRDWAFWRDASGAAACAAAYMEEIDRTQRGIILMHDSIADLHEARTNNRTFEMVRILVPQLLALGYRFVPLNEIPVVD